MEVAVVATYPRHQTAVKVVGLCRQKLRQIAVQRWEHKLPPECIVVNFVYSATKNYLS